MLTKITSEDPERCFDWCIYYIHGTTQMSKNILQSYLSQKTIKLYLTATYAKPEASFIATKKFVFWLKRIASAMAKTKAMCIINRSSKRTSVQHEKKHDKGSKNSSSYFDDKIFEHETDKLIADDRFD